MQEIKGAFMISISILLVDISLLQRTFFFMMHVIVLQ